MYNIITTLGSLVSQHQNYSSIAVHHLIGLEDKRAVSTGSVGIILMCNEPAHGQASSSVLGFNPSISCPGSKGVVVEVFVPV